MAGFNRIIMMGNLTRDPELRQLPSGQTVCRLGLAANRSYKNRQTGDMVEEVCFVDVDVWGAQAESCNQYLAKGRPVLIEGRLKLDSWQDKEGNNRSKHSIVADRVVFMPSAMQAEESFEDESRTKVEEDILKQVEEKAKKAAQKTTTEFEEKTFGAAKKDEPSKRKSKKEEKDESTSDELVSNNGELSFKDEPPFKDDLPF